MIESFWRHFGDNPKCFNLFLIYIYIVLWAVRTNNLFLTLFVKIKVLVAYAVPKNYVVVKLLIIQMYTALFPFNRGRIYPE